jgi:hypothetical protein
VAPVRRDARPHLGAAGAAGLITAPCTQSAATKKRRTTGAVSKKSRDLVSVRRGRVAIACFPACMTKKTRIVLQPDGDGCRMLPRFGAQIGNVG